MEFVMFLMIHLPTPANTRPIYNRLVNTNPLHPESLYPPGPSWSILVTHTIFDGKVGPCCFSSTVVLQDPKISLPSLIMAASERSDAPPIKAFSMFKEETVCEESKPEKTGWESCFFYFFNFFSFLIQKFIKVMPATKKILRQLPSFGHFEVFDLLIISCWCKTLGKVCSFLATETPTTSLALALFGRRGHADGHGFGHAKAGEFLSSFQELQPGSDAFFSWWVSVASKAISWSSLATIVLGKVNNSGWINGKKINADEETKTSIFFTQQHVLLLIAKTIILSCKNNHEKGWHLIFGPAALTTTPSSSHMPELMIKVEMYHSHKKDLQTKNPSPMCPKTRSPGGI